MPKVTPEYLDARRREILVAARTLFAQKGFARTSMADVVAATGLSTGSVYRYFPSKGDLVLAVCEDGQDEEFGADTPVAAVDRLLGNVHPGREDGRAHARLVSQIWADAALDERLAPVVAGRHAGLRDLLAGLIAQESPGDDPSARDRAEVVLAALVGYAALVGVDAPVDHDGFARALVAALRG
ncbi:TetR/AcrR family transcriptional regulator [Umezawaea beigongshangensis]|uniref:TetR/AcrR family transcriptional regulator n=1 Tax=Umezawaea beigongshangensis TaxID=2780383 RepID=UPI0018F114D7|nr:TetR/AcrR family transcriptional regulator [Umezawaea beigongshangensis]